LRNVPLGLDDVLLRELSELQILRNLVAHAKTGDESPSINQVYQYLQIAMHFIKVKSPSTFASVESKPYKSLTGAHMRSKSEVIIGNILTSLGLQYDYEKPLCALNNQSDYRRPDFTIKFKNKIFYWEHLSAAYKENEDYRKLWDEKKTWYCQNDYMDRLIVSEESEKEPLDSQKIEHLVKEKILTN
jgi:hypothetical protein